MSTPSNLPGGIELAVQLGRDLPGWHKCPRCLRWTPSDGPEWPTTDGHRGAIVGVICWRCQEVLCHDHADHEAGRLVIEWREARGLPVN